MAMNTGSMILAAIIVFVIAIIIWLISRSRGTIGSMARKGFGAVMSEKKGAERSQRDFDKAAGDFDDEKVKDKGDLAKLSKALAKKKKEMTTLKNHLAEDRKLVKTFLSAATNTVTKMKSNTELQDLNSPENTRDVISSIVSQIGKAENFVDQVRKKEKDNTTLIDTMLRQVTEIENRVNGVHNLVETAVNNEGATSEDLRKIKVDNVAIIALEPKLVDIARQRAGVVGEIREINKKLIKIRNGVESLIKTTKSKVEALKRAAESVEPAA
ncbi:hypothetical protein HOD38_01535 [archaeon]|jgi:hypothetical protein|nr:hypothetical protein [archaeon]MBT4396927.1 hypothetical protein [archaeon]MBT4440918.1 hypothetical protein [archaeon]